jgi:hypothetical protein
MRDYRIFGCGNAALGNLRFPFVFLRDLVFAVSDPGWMRFQLLLSGRCTIRSGPWRRRRLIASFSCPSRES